VYARVISSETVDPAAADEALAVVRDYILPRAREQKGYKGYLLIGDLNSGKSIGVTFWETEEDRAASGEDSAYFTENMARLASLMKGPAQVQDMEVFIQD
jgi:hypothetical protein